MSIFQDQAWKYQFNNTLLLTYQQMQSLVRSRVSSMMIHHGVVGAIDHHERLGNGIANDVVSPYAQTVYHNLNHSRRAVTLVSSDATVAISDEHIVRGMTNPQDGYTQTILAMLRRREDKHVIDALIGSAQVAAVTAGTGVITYSTQALPSARAIGDNTAMSLARIINAGELLSKAGIPLDDQLTMLYSPGQRRDIMAITQASSSDFTKNKIHDKGTINGIDWEGFRWIEIADVVSEDGSTVIGRMLQLPATDTRYCIAFHASGVGISIGKDIQAQGDPAPWLQSRPTQVRVSMIMAAVRVWEGAVVRVSALEN